MAEIITSVVEKEGRYITPVLFLAGDRIYFDGGSRPATEEEKRMRDIFYREPVKQEPKPDRAPLPMELCFTNVEKIAMFFMDCSAATANGESSEKS